MKIIQSNNNSVAYNLALEEYLFSEFQDDYLLFYVNEKSVVLGSNQSVRNEVNIDFCVANNIQIVRRKSGGGAVLHDLGNLNFSFIRNKVADKNSLSADFLLPVVALLGELGVSATIGERKDLWLPDGHKITGTASHIRKSRELHHGTLLVDTNLELLKQALYVPIIDYTVKATLSVRSKTKNILAFLSDNGISDLSKKDFIEKFIAAAERYYTTAKVGNTYFDQIKIMEYQTNYLSDTWNKRK